MSLVTALVFSLAARPTIAMSAFGPEVSWAWQATWGSPRWNWGSARGTAHDRAALLRPALRSTEARATWMTTAPVGELLFGLALAVQHTQNMGRVTPLSGVMAALCSGRLRDEQAVCSSLLEQLQAAPGLSRMDPSSARLPVITELPDSVEWRKQILAAALDSLDFVERGM